MIRFIDINDIEKVNKLLEEFNFNINKSLFKDSFFRCIVYDDTNIKGTIVFKEIYERIEIDYIVVQKKFRNSKIATGLMEYLINYSKEKNIESISLEVNVNNCAAINLYKKFDFKIVAKRKNYYKGEDGYLMVKVIK